MATGSNGNAAGGGGGVLLGIFIASGFATAIGVIGAFVVKSMDVADSHPRDTSRSDGTPSHTDPSSDSSDKGRPYWPSIDDFYANINKRVADIQRKLDEDKSLAEIKKYAIKRREIYAQIQTDFLKKIECAALHEFYQKIIDHLSDMSHTLTTAASAANNLYRQMLIDAVERDDAKFNAEVDEIVNGIKGRLGRQTSGGTTLRHQFLQASQAHGREFAQMDDADDNYLERKKLRLCLLVKLHDAAGRIMSSASSVTGGGSETTGAKLDALAPEIKSAYANFNWEYAQRRQGQQRQQQ